MFFYYVRHGTPTYDPDALTELGHKQAEALSKRLALYGLDEIYASTSTRAIQTAEPTARVLSKEITLVDWANEAHAWQEQSKPYGLDRWTWPFQNPVLKEKFHQNEILALGKCWYTHPDFKDTAFEASMARIGDAADAFFLSLGYRHNREENCFEAVAPHDKRVALFAHQGFGMSFLSHVLDIPYPMFCMHFDIGHSGVSVIHFEESEGGKVYPKVLQLSNDSHLYKENVLTGYHNVWDI